MLIVAVDPGLVTGVAYVRSISEPIQKIKPNHKDTWIFQTKELSALKSVDYVNELISSESMFTKKLDVSIYAERYDINEYTLEQTRQYEALEVIGALKWLAHTWMIDFHPSSRGSRFLATGPALRYFGWYNTSPDHHMVDAAKHLMVACMKRRLISAEDMLSANRE